jgi:hypothetical protein
MKKILAIIICLALLATVVTLTRQPLANDYHGYKFIVSTDGGAGKGQFQEILVQTFEVAEGQARPLSATSTFSIQINGEFVNKSAKNHRQTRRVMPMKQLSASTTLGKILIPPDSNAGSLLVTVTPFGRTSPVLASASVNIGRELSLIALPSQSHLEPGKTVDFSLAVFESKTLKGEFRQPIRVKMLSPKGHLVLNRVVITNLEGLASFSTHISHLAPLGDYRFEFTHLGNVLSYVLPLVGPADADLALSLLSDGRGDLLRDIQPNPNNLEQAIVRYDCTGADYIFAEIWQNGNLLYGGQQQLDAGVGVLPYTRKASPNQPILIKLTQFKAGAIYKEGRRVLYTKPFKPSNAKQQHISRLLTEGASLISPRNQLLFSKALFFTTNDFYTNLDLELRQEKPVKFVVQGQRLSEIAQQSKIKPVTGASKQPNAMENVIPRRAASTGIKNNRFFMVDEELNLSRYSFKQLRLWQSSESFTEAFLSLSKEYEYEFDELLEVVILFVRLSNGVSPELKQQILETLEGHMTVIMDFWLKIHANKALFSRYENRLAETVFYLSQLVFVPKELTDSLSPQKVNPHRTLILPSFFGQGIKFDQLNESFIKGGRAVLMTNNQCINLNLITDNYNFNTKALSKGKNDIISKLINLRTKPLVAELVFR